MKKNLRNSFVAVLATICFQSVNAQTTTWNFSTTSPSWAFTGIGGTATPTPVMQTVDPQGLGLYGITTNLNFAAWNTQSSSTWASPNDAFSGTVRVQTNGAGFAGGGNESTPTQRYFFIQVNQACTVKIWFKSGSSSAARSVIVSNGTVNYGKATSIAPSTSVTGFPSDGGFLSASVTAAGTFYIYGDAAINIYQIQVVGATVSLTPNNSLVPVVFKNISATSTNGLTKVNWEIATEINTDKYEVEKSANGKDYSFIGSAAATRSSKYSYTDQLPLVGVNYYRIKAIDKDGSFGYSSVVKIGGKQTQTDVTVAPNPVKGGQLNIQMSNFEKGTYSASLFDATGKQVFSKSMNVEAANAAQTLQLPSTVQPGIYQLQVTNGLSRITKTVMVQ